MKNKTNSIKAVVIIALIGTASTLVHKYQEIKAEQNIINSEDFDCTYEREKGCTKQEIAQSGQVSHIIYLDDYSANDSYIIKKDSKTNIGSDLSVELLSNSNLAFHCTNENDEVISVEKSLSKNLHNTTVMIGVNLCNTSLEGYVFKLHEDNGLFKLPFNYTEGLVDLGHYKTAGFIVRDIKTTQ